MSDTDTTDAPAVYAFPFEVPADLSTVSDTDLRALHRQIREHASGFTGLSPAETTDSTLAALSACRDLAVAVAGILNGRRDRAVAAAAFADEIDALPEDGTDGDDGDGEGDADGADGDPADADAASTTVAAVTAARPRTPGVRDVARRGSRAPVLPADRGRTRYGTMRANADIGGYSIGQNLERFDDAARALSARMDQFPARTQVRAAGKFTGARRPVTVFDEGSPGRRFELKSYVRQPVVELHRDFPAELRVNDGEGDRRGYAVAEYAANEKRLPGGGLIASAQMAVKAGRSLTAAAGWCAPSDVIYDLCELETLDGILDAPQLQTTRGGWQIPILGGPDFASIYESLGDSGDTHLTETDVINEVAKVCTEVPCPPFEDVRLGVDYYCITGGLLQRRGYPEIVARFARGAVVALAHKINQGFIAAIVTGSGATHTIPSDPSGDDAASSLLTAVELAVVDAKYRNRMSFTGPMEVVLPWWVLVPIRAALARRTGVAMLAVTDAMILEWFTIRGAVPRFVYDWQDNFSGLTTGPGTAAGLLTLPATVQFLIYPAGTWVKAVQDVVALDTIYDSTMLATNQFTAVFAEDGWAALQLCAFSRLYTVAVDPSGVTGCCPSIQS
jgi:hypothetical protein